MISDRQHEDSLVHPWDLPNEDAGQYLTGYVQTLLDGYNRQGYLFSDYFRPEVNSDEFGAFLNLDAELEGRGFVGSLFPPDRYADEDDEIGANFRRLVERTQVAIEDGDAEDTLALIDDLVLQLRRPPDTADVENWAPLLVATTEVHSQSSQRQECDRDEIEQRTISAINDLCVRLCELIAKDETALKHIEWRHLEMVVATALNGLGFDITLTPPSKDGGKDVVASCRLQGQTLTYYIEIKHWRSGKRVNDTLIYDFVEVNLGDATDGGLYLSTSGYTKDVFTQLGEICSARSGSRDTKRSFRCVSISYAKDLDYGQRRNSFQMFCSKASSRNPATA